MIDATEFYILILVWVTLTFNQGHMDARKPNSCTDDLTKLSVDLDRILFAI